MFKIIVQGTECEIGIGSLSDSLMEKINKFIEDVDYPDEIFDENNWLKISGKNITDFDDIYHDSPFLLNSCSFSIADESDEKEVEYSGEYGGIFEGEIANYDSKPFIKLKDGFYLRFCYENRGIIGSYNLEMESYENLIDENKENWDLSRSGFMTFKGELMGLDYDDLCTDFICDCDLIELDRDIYDTVGKSIDVRIIKVINGMVSDFIYEGLINCKQDDETEIPNDIMGIPKDKNDLYKLLKKTKNNENYENVRLIIEKDIDLNYSDHGMTALMWAVTNQNYDIVKYFIENGADLSAKSNKGNTPFLLYFVIGNIVDIEILKLLIEKGCDVNTKNYSEESALHFVLKNRFDFEHLKILVENGADINVKDKNGKTALMYAYKMEVVDYLISNGAVFEKNYSTNDGETYLMHFCDNNIGLNYIKDLIEQGEDINSHNNLGETALHIAVRRKYYEAIKLLIENNADINVLTKFGAPITVYLLDRQHVNFDYFEILQILIENGADINAKDKNGKTALMYAEEKEVVEYLINHGAEYDINYTANDGINYLMSFIRHESSGCNIFVKELIDKGSDINKSDNYLNTPLIQASEVSNFEIVKILIEKGADVNAKSKYGWTPLTHAAEQSNLVLMKYLVENGANVNLKGYDDKTAMKWAKQDGIKEMIAYLKSVGAK